MASTKHIGLFWLDRLLKTRRSDGWLEEGAAEAAQTAPAQQHVISESSSSMLKALLGGIGALGEPYFPPDMIGGTCPRLAGEEEEIVWNAAAEACDSERVHVVWQCFENRIWYLAIKSSELASHPHSWCPLAGLLPAMKGAATPPVCYAYFGDEIAVLMIVTLDGLQVFRGTAPVVRAKAERVSRELGNAPIITLDQDFIDQITPVPWYSVSLFENRARRILAALSVAGALALSGIAILIWLIASLSMVASRQSLSGALERNQQKSMELVKQAEALRASPMRDQIGKFLTINDALLSLNGFLDIYEIKDGHARWRAVVPPSATADRITAIGGKNIEVNEKGVIIGNEAEVQYEASKERP